MDVHTLLQSKLAMNWRQYKTWTLDCTVDWTLDSIIDSIFGLEFQLPGDRSHAKLPSSSGDIT